MDALCHPLTSPQNVHGRGGEKGLKPELFAANIAGAAHFTCAHRLGNGPFDPGSFGVHRAKLGGLFSSASLLKSPIRLFIGL